MMGQYLIEIGQQVCLTQNGITAVTESNIHLRKFTTDQVAWVFQPGSQSTRLI